MIPYLLENSSVFSSDNDSDHLGNCFLPTNTDLFGLEFLYSTGNPDPYENEHNLDLFTFLLDKDDMVFNDQLFFYGNGGDETSPVIIRELCDGIWGYPVESDAHYIYMNRMPKEVKTILFAGFLYEATNRNQSLQDLRFIRVRLFSIDKHSEEGKTVFQYTVHPDLFGSEKYNIVVFLSFVRNNNRWELIKQNLPINCDPSKFVEKYGVK